MARFFDGFKWGFGASVAGALVSWLSYIWMIRKWDKRLSDDEPDEEPVKKGYTRLDFHTAD